MRRKLLLSSPGYLNVRRGLGIIGSMLCFLISLIPFNPVAAETGFIDPNADGSIGTAWAATPTGTRYTTIDDGVRQPDTPNTADYISVGSGNVNVTFMQMSTLSQVTEVTSIQLWIYHTNGLNGQVVAGLYDNAETTQYGSEQTFAAVPLGNAWGSVTFSGLSLSQSQLDGLRVRFRATKQTGAGSTLRIYAMYGVVNYTSGTLSADVVDSSGNPVGSPVVSLSAVNANIDCQTSTGSLGGSAQRIRVSNTTPSGNWTLAIAATGGTSSTWSNGTNSYDFNDPAGCGDGGDGDTLAGQLQINPSGGTITPQAACSTTGISKGALSAFSQGTTDTITLLSASGSQTGCYFDLTDVAISQQIPGEVPASATPYSINMTLTLTAD